MLGHPGRVLPSPHRGPLLTGGDLSVSTALNGFLPHLPFGVSQSPVLNKPLVPCPCLRLASVELSLRQWPGRDMGGGQREGTRGDKTPPVVVNCLCPLGAQMAGHTLIHMLLRKYFSDEINI